jgi:hypothetical protein
MKRLRQRGGREEPSDKQLKKLKIKKSVREQCNTTCCSPMEEKSCLHFKNIIRWSDVFKVLLTHSRLKVKMTNPFGML